MKLLAVCGSLQRRSANHALLELAARLAPAGVELSPSIALGRLPHYNPELDVEPAPASVLEWRTQLRAAEGVLVASPEYGHGMPGALKNALDWIVGSGELVGRPVAATCASQGKGRGLLGLASLVQTLRAVDAVVVWSGPIVVERRKLGDNGRIEDPAAMRETSALLETLLRARAAR